MATERRVCEREIVNEMQYNVMGVWERESGEPLRVLTSQRCTFMGVRDSR